MIRSLIMRLVLALPLAAALLISSLAPVPCRAFARPVESVQYDPSGTPSIHSRNGDGTAYLRVYNETKTSTFSSDLVTSNTREDDPYSNYLSAQFSPIGATGLSTRVPGSVALSSNAGGRIGEFPARQMVGLNQAVRAATTFLNSGQLDSSLILQKQE